MGPGDVLLGALFFICTMVVLVSAIVTHHRRKMFEMQLAAQRQAKPLPQPSTLDQEFLTLREGLTAHAMSVDENVKALAARMAALENRAQSQESTSQRVSG